MPLRRTSVSRSLTRTRRVVGALAASGLAATAGWAALTVPAQADDGVTVTNVVTTSDKAESWSLINLNASWTADHPAAGQTFSVTLGEGLTWPSGLDFVLQNKEAPDVSVGTCAADGGSNVLTCTLNNNITQWDHVDGTLWARGQLTDKALGKKDFTVTASGRNYTVLAGDKDGDGVCEAGCGGVTSPPAVRDTHKAGWFVSQSADGGYRFQWEVNVTGSTSYTVIDEGATFESVTCTDSDWDHAWTPGDVASDPAAHKVSWTVGAQGSSNSVCRALYNSTSSTASATNKAVVNNETVTAESQANAIGGGDAMGTRRASTPTPTPSAPSETPTPTPTMPAETPSLPVTTTESAPAVPAPPTDTTTAPVPSSSTPEKPAPPTLARTGAATGAAGVVAVVALAAGGAGLTISRRRA